MWRRLEASPHAPTCFVCGRTRMGLPRGGVVRLTCRHPSIEYLTFVTVEPLILLVDLCDVGRDDAEDGVRVR